MKKAETETLNKYIDSLDDFHLIARIKVLNDEYKKLDEEIKAMKKEAQNRFPVGLTVINNASVNIKEVAREGFDVKQFQIDHPALCAQYRTAIAYKTVQCEVV